MTSFLRRPWSLERAPQARGMRGFTLIETLVAIAILTTAIVGPFVAIQSAMNASYVARDQLVATMLAQEGVEYVRSVRDANFMEIIQDPAGGRSWLQGLDGTASTVDCLDEDPDSGPQLRCLVDPFGSPTVALCNSSGAGLCVPLNLSSSGLYTHEAGTATRFTRYLEMERISATEVRVRVTVAFSTGHRSYSSVIDEVLYNWL